MGLPSPLVDKFIIRTWVPYCFWSVFIWAQAPQVQVSAVTEGAKDQLVFSMFLLGLKHCYSGTEVWSPGEAQGLQSTPISNKFGRHVDLPKTLAIPNTLQRYFGFFILTRYVDSLLLDGLSDSCQICYIWRDFWCIVMAKLWIYMPSSCKQEVCHKFFMLRMIWLKFYRFLFTMDIHMPRAALRSSTTIWQQKDWLFHWSLLKTKSFNCYVVLI